MRNENVSRPTNVQIEFAKGMSVRQWGVLRSLAMCPFFMSASERADPEMTSLFTNKLVVSHSTTADPFGLFQWQATEEGRAIVRRRTEGKL